MIVVIVFISVGGLWGDRGAGWLMPWAQAIFPDSATDSTAEAGRQIRITQGIAGTVRYQRMIRSMGMALVAVLLLMELMFLPTRSNILDYFGNDRPWMKLPDASNSRHYHGTHFGEELSWTKTGGWVGAAGAIKQPEMDGFLRRAVERSEAHGLLFNLRLRIPADAEAGHFTEAAMAAQRAGVSRLHVAVIKPQTARSSAGAGR
jgi:hypothetical protein